jgi:hypothetical protein
VPLSLKVWFRIFFCTPVSVAIEVAQEAQVVVMNVEDRRGVRLRSLPALLHRKLAASVSALNELSNGS